MKNYRLLWSIIPIVLTASLILSACGGADAPTEAPAAPASEATAAPNNAVSTAVPAAPYDTAVPGAPAATSAPANPGATSAPVQGNANTLADLGFRPDKNGFPFANYGNGNYTNLIPDDMNTIFGDVVCANKTDGKCTLIPPADQWMQQTNEAMNGGHCYGMAQASLLFYQNKLNPADFNGTAISDVKLDSNDKLQREIASDWSGQKLDKVRAGVITGTPNDVIEKLIAALNAGPSGEVYVAGFFKADGTGGHAVTPYAVEDRGSGMNAVMIYDNNYPGVAREMLFDRNANSWSYEASINPSVASEKYSGDANTTSFFLFPVSPATQQSPCPFCSGGVSAGKGLGLASLAEEQNEVYLDGEANLLIKDESGNQLGYVNDKLVNEIPGASYEVPMADDYNSDLEPVYNIPTSVNLNITVDGSQLKEAAPTDVVVVGPGYYLGVESITLEPGQKDELTIQTKDDFISFRTDSSESPDFIIGLERQGADFEFDLKGTDIAGGGRINMSVDPKSGDLLVNADELKKDGTFDLSMTRIDDKTEESFTSSDISLKAGAVLYVDFSEWKGNGTPVTLGIDTNGDGTIDQTFTSDDQN